MFDPYLDAISADFKSTFTKVDDNVISNILYEEDLEEVERIILKYVSQVQVRFEKQQSVGGNKNVYLIRIVPKLCPASHIPKHESYESLKEVKQWDGQKFIVNKVSLRGYLELISSGEGGSEKVRTKRTFGNMTVPSKGRGVVLYSTALKPRTLEQATDPTLSDIRTIHTSNVQEVEKVTNSEIVFRTTLGARYRIVVHERILKQNTERQT